MANVASLLGRIEGRRLEGEPAVGAPVEVGYEAHAEADALVAEVSGDALRPNCSLTGQAYASLAAQDLSRVADVDAEDDAAPADPRGLYRVDVAVAEGGAGAGVVAGDAVAPRASLAGVPYAAQAAPDISRITDVDREGDAAPATPAGPYGVRTARAEGVGFPAVVGGQAVAEQATTTGVPLGVQTSPSGDRYADVDAHDDAAPANPRGAYPLGVARAEGAPSAAVVAGDAAIHTTSLNAIPFAALTDASLSRIADVDAEDDAAPADPRGLYRIDVAVDEGGAGAGVIAGDAVVPRTSTSGVPHGTISAPDLSRIADVDREDDPAPANPAGIYPLDVAVAEAGVGAGVVAADAVVPRSSLNGVRFTALTDSDITRVADVDAENEPAPVAPRGLYAGGRATAALVALANGDYAVLSFDLAGLLRTTQPAPGTGKDAIHVGAASAALGAGANTVTVYTVPASRHHRTGILVCRYTGTIGGGTTLQIRVGGVAMGLAQGGLASGADVVLFQGEVTADAAEAIQVQVEGATAGDTITYAYHGTDEVVS